MFVSMTEVDNGTETPRGTADLRDLFPDDDSGHDDANDELHRIGRYWYGGGSAPLVLLRPLPPYGDGGDY